MTKVVECLFSAEALVDVFDDEHMSCHCLCKTTYVYQLLQRWRIWF